MSQKAKARRAAREARQEKEGKQIVNWVFGILIAAAVLFLILQVV